MKTCVGKKSRGKYKNRRRLGGVNVIPTDGMFTETEFSRPCLPDIPADREIPPIQIPKRAERIPILRHIGQRAAQFPEEEQFLYNFGTACHRLKTRVNVT